MGESLGNPMNRIVRASQDAVLARAAMGITSSEMRPVPRIAAAAGRLGSAALGGAVEISGSANISGGVSNGERLHPGESERELNPTHRRAGRI